MEWSSNASPEATQSRGLQAGESSIPPIGNAPTRIIVFDFATKQTESCVVFFFAFFVVYGYGDVSDVLCVNRSTRLEGDLTSVQITQDSQYALINHSPNVRVSPCYLLLDLCSL